MMRLAAILPNPSALGFGTMAAGGGIIVPYGVRKDEDGQSVDIYRQS